MRSRTNLLTTFLLLACACAGSAQSVNLIASADTTIRKNWPNDSRATNGLEVRSTTAPRQQIAYIRFHLQELTATPAAGAIFSITRPAGGSSTSDTQMELYGLIDTFNNTPQGWVDSGLTYNTSGLEIPWDGISLARDLDLARVSFLGNLPSSGTAGQTIPFSSAALDAFLSDRYANGGLATLMVVQRDNANRIVNFFNTESGQPAANLPNLTFPSGTLQTIPADTAPPTVAGGTPEPGAVDVLVNTTITARFSEPMDDLTITDANVFLEAPGSVLVPATFAYNAGSLTATITPDANLAQGALYTVTVMGGISGVADAAGNTMPGDFTWTFSTVSDTDPPTVVSTTPVDTATDVAYGTSLTVVFSEALNPATVSNTTITLVDDNLNPVPAGVSFDELTFTATLNPLPLLEPGTTYTATVVGGPGGVADVAGNPVASNHVWTFTTAPFDPSQPISMLPAADTSIRYGTNQANNYGASADLFTRQNDLAPRDYTCYIRFDLSSLTGSISDATLTLTSSGGDTLVPERIRILGLNDVAGNTPQNWDELALTFDNSGDEITNPPGSYNPGPPIAGDTIFDLGRVTDFEGGTPGIVETAGAGVGSISGAALAAWLEGRRQNGGLATFLVDFPAFGGTNDRSINYASREHLTLEPPTLTVSVDFIPLITAVEYLPGGPSVKLTWTGIDSQSYTVERSDTGLETPTWLPVVEGLAGAAVNTHTDSTLATTEAYYRVVVGPPLPYFLDDFDGAALGWTAETDGFTTWELGTPSSGPGAAASGANCYGTNLAGDYSFDADVSLLSPVIDLTGVTDAVLSFDHFFDTEVLADACEVYIRDAAGGVITGLELPLATYDDFITDWEPVSLALPAAAQNRTMTIEFRFVSDSSVEFAGWYIDNVSVATP